MATGAKGTWPQEVSGSPGPQLPPWGVFSPLPTARILTARKNGLLLCLVQNHSLRSNCLGSLPHETYPTASGAGGGGDSEGTQEGTGGLNCTRPPSGTDASQSRLNGAEWLRCC